MSNRKGRSSDYEDLFAYPDEKGNWDGEEQIKKLPKRAQDPEQQKQRKRKLKSMAIVVLALLLLGIVIYIVSRFWKINDVIVVGLGGTYSAENIEELGGIKAGTRVCEINVEEIKTKIETDPHLLVKRQQFEFPFAYRIEVKEREEYAMIQYLQQYVYIDQDGIVLDICTAPKDNGAIVVRGLSVSGFAVNDPLGSNDEYQFYVLTELLHALDDSGQRGWFVTVDVTNPVDVNLLSENQIWVKLGQPVDMTAKLTSVAALLYSLESNGVTGGMIDVLRLDNMVYSPAPIEGGQQESEPEIPEGETADENQEGEAASDFEGSSVEDAIDEETNNMPNDEEDFSQGEDEIVEDNSLGNDEIFIPEEE